MSLAPTSLAVVPDTKPPAHTHPGRRGATCSTTPALPLPRPHEYPSLSASRLGNARHFSPLPKWHNTGHAMGLHRRPLLTQRSASPTQEPTTSAATSPTTRRAHEDGYSRPSK
jgi:hypothetical protein